METYAEFDVNGHFPVLTDGSIRLFDAHNYPKDQPTNLNADEESPSSSAENDSDDESSDSSELKDGRVMHAHPHMKAWRVKHGDTEVISTTTLAPFENFTRRVMDHQSGEENVELHGNWSTVTVLRRGHAFYDTQMAAKDSELYTEQSWSVDDANRVCGPTMVCVGLSVSNLMPVFICKTPNSPSVQEYVDSSLNPETRHDFRTMDMEKVGGRIVPFASITTFGVVRAIKALVNMERGNNARLGSILRRYLTQMPRQELIKRCHNTRDALASGHPKSYLVCDRGELATPKDILYESFSKHSVLYPERGVRFDNRRWEHQIPHLSPYHYYGMTWETFEQQWLGCGFRYEVPFIKTRVYDPELHEILEEFAYEYPDDKLNSTAMVFAAQLWHDIMSTPTLMKEEFARGQESEGWEVPHVPLAVMILYFEQWIRLHEELGLLLYIHPFRFIKTLYDHDIRRHLKHHESDSGTEPDDRRDANLVVDTGAIDEEKVRRLLSNVTTTIPGIPVSARQRMIPASWHGSKIPFPAGHYSLRPPSAIIQGLIGFPVPSFLGLPGPITSDEAFMNIAMPDKLLSQCYGGDRLPMTLSISELKEATTMGVGDRGRTYPLSSILVTPGSHAAVWHSLFPPEQDHEKLRAKHQIRKARQLLKAAGRAGIRCRIDTDTRMDLQEFSRQKHEELWQRISKETGVDMFEKYPLLLDEIGVPIPSGDWTDRKRRDDSDVIRVVKRVRTEHVIIDEGLPGFAPHIEASSRDNLVTLGESSSAGRR